MPALWVLAVVALLLVLILSTRVRVVFAARDGALSLEVRAAFIRYRVFPAPERKPAPKKKTPEKPKKPVKKRTPAETVERMLSMAGRLWEPVTAVLRNIRGAVRLDPLTVRVVYGGRDDPANAAIYCGDTLAAVWAVMPALETLCRVPRPSITVRTDFDASGSRFDAEIGLTVRVWAALVSLLPLLQLLRKEIPKHPKTERTDSHGKKQRAQ